MFTGIIAEIGKVRAVSAGSGLWRIGITSNHVAQGAKKGDSIAVNGACLTVVHMLPQGFEAEIMPESWRRTTFYTLKPGDGVQLERALQASGHFDGHQVLGDVDGVGKIRAVKPDGKALVVQIEPENQDMLEFIVEKGRVAIDGASLTVVSTDSFSFSVALIPFTQNMLLLGKKHLGAVVNLETDVAMKVTVAALRREEAKVDARKPQVTLESLRKAGF